ncbi:hypothetical protein TUM4644_14040 [Shewanella colwelliana]|nr:hypothetical protein TUM4644_14040 [Shewanella colwelliana]
MKSDFNPTVASLIKQKAIRLIGDIERLAHFSKEYFHALVGYDFKPSFESAGGPIGIFNENNYDCSGQLTLATILEFNQNNRSDSLGVSPPLY